MSIARNRPGLFADRRRPHTALAMIESRGSFEFPAVLRRRIAGQEQVVAEGPLRVIVEAMAWLPVAQRNEFTIGFALPPVAADGWA